MPVTEPTTDGLIEPALEEASAITGKAVFVADVDADDGDGEPYSAVLAGVGQCDGSVVAKQSLNMQHRDVDSYVDLLSDVPLELYVK